MNQLLMPRIYAQSIWTIPYFWLRGYGICGLVFDLDATLMNKKDKEPSADLVKLISSLKRAGFRICLLTNAVLEKKKVRAERIAEQLGVDCVALKRHLKPNERGYLEALDKLALPRTKVAMIGDQVATDILGANRLGIFTVLVDPIGSHSLVSYACATRRLKDWLVRRALMPCRITEKVTFPT